MEKERKQKRMTKPHKEHKSLAEMRDFFIIADADFFSLLDEEIWFMRRVIKGTANPGDTNPMCFGCDSCPLETKQFCDCIVAIDEGIECNWRIAAHKYLKYLLYLQKTKKESITNVRKRYGADV